jgi:hypothetical protein
MEKLVMDKANSEIKEKIKQFIHIFFNSIYSEDDSNVFLTPDEFEEFFGIPYTGNFHLKNALNHFIEQYREIFKIYGIEVITEQPDHNYKFITYKNKRVYIDKAIV